MAGAITVATVSVYLKDPDGNGIELTYDRPRDQWFDERRRLRAEERPVRRLRPAGRRRRGHAASDSRAVGAVN